MTARAAFKQIDVKRLILGAEAARKPDQTIRLIASPDGTLTLDIIPKADNDDAPGSSWDDA